MLLDGCVLNDDEDATSGDNTCPPVLECPMKDISCVSCDASNLISNPNVTSEQSCSGKYRHTYFNVLVNNNICL